MPWIQHAASALRLVICLVDYTVYRGLGLRVLGCGITDDGLGCRVFALRVSTGAGLNPWSLKNNIGALIITYTMLVVPHYDYGIMGPKTLF